MSLKTCLYTCPCKYQDAWHILVDEHLHSGWIYPSSSNITSLAFLIAKADCTALLCWVNDYCKLNKHTTPDAFPLPCCDKILKGCTQGKVWATLDMTNASFQTLMHLNDIHLTAITLGLYK